MRLGAHVLAEERRGLFGVLICWFRGHCWRYDRHVWGSGLDPHDRYVCETCRCDHLEPVEWRSEPAPAAAAAAEAAA